MSSHIQIWCYTDCQQIDSSQHIESGQTAEWLTHGEWSTYGEWSTKKGCSSCREGSAKTMWSTGRVVNIQRVVKIQRVVNRQRTVNTKRVLNIYSKWSTHTETANTRLQNINWLFVNSWHVTEVRWQDVDVTALHVRDHVKLNMKCATLDFYSILMIKCTAFACYQYIQRGQHKLWTSVGMNHRVTGFRLGVIKQGLPVLHVCSLLQRCFWYYKITICLQDETGLSQHLVTWITNISRVSVARRGRYALIQVTCAEIILSHL